MEEALFSSGCCFLLGLGGYVCGIFYFFFKQRCTKVQVGEGSRMRAENTPEQKKA